MRPDFINCTHPNPICICVKRRSYSQEKLRAASSKEKISSQEINRKKLPTLSKSANVKRSSSVHGQRRNRSQDSVPRCFYFDI